ncbi:MAG: enolase C-terminal domain-like protein [Euryarchaeota archaeon]
MRLRPVRLELRRPFRISRGAVERVRGYLCRCRMAGGRGTGFGLTRRVAEELAALDALTRAAGLPLRDALGGGRDSVRSFATVDLVGPERAEKLARAYRESGYDLLKVKVGSGSLEDDVRRVRACVRVGGFRALILDGNAGLNPEEALELLDRVEFHGDVYLEQPTPPGELDEVRGSCDAPVIVDAMDVGADRLEEILHGDAADLVNVKVQELGLLGGLRVARRARELGLGVMVGCAVESFCSIAAAAHLAGAVDAELCDLDGHLFLREDVVENPGPAPELELTGPGWGVRVVR